MPIVFFRIEMTPVIGRLRRMKNVPGFFSRERTTRSVLPGVPGSHSRVPGCTWGRSDVCLTVSARQLPGTLPGCRNPGPHRAPLYLFCLCPRMEETMKFEDYRLLMSHVFNIRHSKNTVILLEQSAFLRRELMRRYRATLQWPNADAYEH